MLAGSSLSVVVVVVVVVAGPRTAFDGQSQLRLASLCCDPRH